MLEVKFYDTVADALLEFAVIVAKYQDKWVFCKHKMRDTYECPGGHRELDETIEETARRELWEETGAVKFQLQPVCVYSVLRDGIETFGMLYYADIVVFEDLPQLEIEKVEFFSDLPTAWTYPLIQPKLLDKVKEIIENE